MTPRTLPVFLCILLVLTVAGDTRPIQAFQHEHDLQNAAAFLRAQYNSTFHLLAEAPGIVPAVYWLWNDNFLGYYALRCYYPEIATTIWEMLQSYGYLKNHAYEALFGQPVDLPFRSPTNHTIEEGVDYTIELDIYNGSHMEDWQNYANLLCLAALSEHWQRHCTAAVVYFNAAAAMWDGNGLKDAVNDEPLDNEYDRYATYKLALLLYTEKILGRTLSFHAKAENTIWRLQNRTNYGIHTNYDAELDPNGSNVNVETTALVIGAYKWHLLLSETRNPTLYVACVLFSSGFLLRAINGRRK